MSERVAILGLGLMGGSLGLALKAVNPKTDVVAYARREATRLDALKLGMVDVAYDNPREAVEGADIVVICTPILTIPELVGEIAPVLKAGAVLTDVGSTKGWLEQAVPPLLTETGAAFVGSHPMAGSEKSGLDSARTDLYQEAIVFVTDSSVSDGAGDCVKQMWQSIGGNVVSITADEHDRLTAYSSHLPHMVAALLVQSLPDDLACLDLACGPGIRDTTRVASGSEDIWHDIVKSNPTAIKEALAGFQLQAAQLNELIEHGEFERIRGYLADARSRRDEIIR